MWPHSAGELSPYSPEQIRVTRLPCRRPTPLLEGVVHDDTVYMRFIMYCNVITYVCVLVNVVVIFHLRFMAEEAFINLNSGTKHNLCVK